jgi:hypothetical protein
MRYDPEITLLARFVALSKYAVQSGSSLNRNHHHGGFFFFFDIHLCVSWGTSPYVAQFRNSFLRQSSLLPDFYHPLALDLLPAPIMK